MTTTKHVHRFIVPGHWVGPYRILGSHGICDCGAVKPYRLPAAANETGPQERMP